MGEEAVGQEASISTGRRWMQVAFKMAPNRKQGTARHVERKGRPERAVNSARRGAFRSAAAGNGRQLQRT